MNIDLTEYGIRQRYAEIRSLAQRIGEHFQREMDKLGFDTERVSLKSFEDADYRLEKDPASGEFTLVGDWLDQRGFKQGTLVFHADGSFFVEQDVIQPHPGKPEWFVEAVNAWGRDDDIKAEARLLPMPD